MEALKVEAYLRLQTPDDAQISPDGRLVAYTLAEVGKEAADKPARSRIWLTPYDGSSPARVLTAGSGADRSPRWAPDSARLAFLSDREQPGKGWQIYLLTLAGGEATPLTRGKGSVTEFAWCRDGARIAFLMADPEPEDQGDVIHFEDRPCFQRLYTVDVATGEVTPVSPEGLQVWEFEESPDGSAFAILASALPWEWSWYEAYLGILPAAGGTVTTLVTTHRQIAAPRWSPDGQQIAYLSSAWSDRGCVVGDLFLVPAAGGEPRHLTAGYEGSLTWVDWQDSEHLLFTGYEGLEATVGQVSVTGKRERYWKGQAGFGPRFWPRFRRAGNRLAVVRESLSELPEVWVADHSEPALAWQVRTDSNPELRNQPRGDGRVIRWRSFDGLEIEGILITPPGYEDGARLPLVTIVHGGPTAQFGCRVNWLWAPFLATRGMAVLLPNPRGSTGRGLAFAEANLGDMGGGDLRDILAGVDACIEMGVADPDRLGIGGWSYGGFMAAWAITQTDRFKAAVVGAGITNWLSFHGVSEIPTWDRAYLKADPYRGDTYARWSPVLHAAKVVTPALLLHGEQDTCVPVGQAYEFFRALREHGVTAHLRVYPREGHGLRERAHMLDSQQAVVDWFQKHLLRD